MRREVQRRLGQIDERWKAQELPHGLGSEVVARPVRVVPLARDIELLYQR